MLVTEKVFGFLIAAIAVQLVLDWLASVGVIGPVPHYHMINPAASAAVAGGTAASDRNLRRPPSIS